MSGVKSSLELRVPRAHGVQAGIHLCRMPANTGWISSGNDRRSERTDSN
jgi:hypothetical protein